jgi:hypothetical protein
MNVTTKVNLFDMKAANAGYSIYNGSFTGGLNYSNSKSDNSEFFDITPDGLAG